MIDIYQIIGKAMDWLQQLFEGQKIPLPAGPQEETWQKILGDISSDKQLQNFIHENPQLKNEILGEITNFVQQEISAQQKKQKNQPKSWEIDRALAEEEAAFDDFQNLAPQQFLSNYPAYLQTFSRYMPNDYSLDFYKFKLNQLSQIPEDQLNINHLQAVHRQLADDWNANLQSRLSALELARIDAQRQQFMLKLYDKIEKYEELMRLLKPFGLNDQLGRFWDNAQGNWRRLDAQILQRYSDTLRRQPQLQQLAQLLGRLQQAQQEFEDFQIEQKKSTPTREFSPAQKEEFIGIRLSDDLPHAMPSELAQLADPHTQPIFLQRWAEKKIQTWAYRASYLAQRTEREILNQRRPKNTQKGPFIICIDTSASMEGTPEQIAKTLCFAILQNAIKTNRPCWLISFSTHIEQIELTELETNLPRLIDFLSMSFHGGTDVAPALGAAVHRIHQQQYHKADVLMISDFVMSHLSADTSEKMRLAREKFGAKFLSLCIGRSPNTQILHQFDQQWHYDPNNPQNLLQLLQKIAPNAPTQS